ncbi:hypothetical protein [Hanstruepera flava]|uniref:hypothetical protein n=1 Tax=Hanstruepera flava TaxID=2930218 RepID=UPI0020281422|nr:hypothetical protein [Hanstruepera flava]
MDKSISILIIFFILFGCHKGANNELMIDLETIKNDFKGETYDLIGNELLPDTLNIQFRDSTFHSFTYDLRMPPWRVSEFENNYFLILNRRPIALKRISEGHYKGLSFIYGDEKLVLKKRQIKFSKEQILGAWIEEKWFDTKVSDFPPLPNLLNDSILSWPPSYKISSDSIMSNKYLLTKSEIDINNTNEFISMHLENPTNQGFESLWKIKSISDSIMIIDRYRQPYFDSKYEWEHNVKLFRKTRTKT